MYLLSFDSMSSIIIIAEGIYLRKWPEGPLSEINARAGGVQPKAEPHCEQRTVVVSLHAHIRTIYACIGLYT